MKNFILIALSVALLISCSDNNQYLVKGSLEGADGETIVLQKRVAGEMVRVDSAVIVDGAFGFSEGSVEYPQMYYLSVDGKRGTKGFFLENSSITISGHIDTIYNAKVNGSVSQDEYTAFNESLSPYYEKNTALYEEYRAAKEKGDEELAEEVSAKRDELFDELRIFQVDYVKSNPSSFVTPVVLRSISYSMDAGELSDVLEALDPSLADVEIVKELAVRVEALRKVAIGEIAPDFTQNDVDGNPITLSELKGHKVLLVDFWAAWCGPCRAENPNVVKVYNDYHSKGFDVLGVSLDNEKDAWLKAIEADKLDWNHVSDLGGWGNEVAKLYAVNSIPANFLVNDKGIIIAKGLRGDDLRAKVAELLD